MAVETPSIGHMLQDYLLVHLFKLSRFSVYRHALVALRTREYTGCKGGRGNKEFSGDILFSCFGTETEE
jgi:hypothetical protein